MRTRFRLWFQVASVIGLAGVFALPAGDARAEDPLAKRIGRESQAARQRKAERAQEIVRDAGLSRAQARQLLPLVDQAAALRLECYELYAEHLPAMIEAFTRFEGEDARNQGFSTQVERDTARLNRQARSAREEMTARLIELEEQAAALLTPAQRDSAAPFRPGRRRDAGNSPQGENGRLAVARRELDRIQRDIHPRPGQISKVLLHPAAGVTLARIAGAEVSDIVRSALRADTYGTEDYPRRDYDRQQATVEELRDRINNWNLINGLHLNGEQIERIVGIYRHVAPMVDDTRKNGRRSTGGVNALRVAFERGVEGVLNAGQREVLAEFKPCLVPPKNLKNPVRVGQANDNSLVERWLERARRAPQRRLPKLVAQALEHEEEHFGTLPPAERRRREAQLLQAGREAAAMSDVEFELGKAEFAQRIAPEDRAQALKARIATLSRIEGLPGPISRFMFDELFVDQLRERARQLEAPTKRPSIDLAKGPQAENCAKGCAIKRTSGTKNRER